ncbi:hypothetical protein RJT34_32886 [Clitoria ternatea]|uniref:Uncharacterized protein n=1 Tax=Clitoria ternatea TaxID=43366 RepID=A0AAN9I2R0_CLITE
MILHHWKRFLSLSLFFVLCLRKIRERKNPPRANLPTRLLSLLFTIPSFVFGFSSRLEGLKFPFFVYPFSVSA